MKRSITYVGVFLLVLGAIGLALWIAALRTPHPAAYTYGVSFNTPYAQELGLDWREAYTAILDDLGVRHLRLAAHWPMVEPEDDAWNFVELDEQVRMAEARGAEVVLAVGRRLPRWPECHVPGWAAARSWDEQKEEIREYLTTVVSRYKDSPAVVLWQVENEPFLGVFAREQCGTLDVAFLDEELSLVRSLDSTRKVLVTDSGNLGTWYGAYKRGDVFGTSVYVYVSNEATGPIRTILPPETYLVKQKLVRYALGQKASVLIELSLEPWLKTSVAHTPLDEQFTQMSINRFNEVLAYARDTRFERQYLWGAEWWYWLRTQKGHPEYWEAAKPLFVQTASETPIKEY